MSEQELELQIKSKSQEAVSTIDKLISGLTNVENGINSISNSLSQTNKISNFINEINKATLSAKRLSKIDMSQFENQLQSMYGIIRTFSNSLTNINGNSIENISKSFKAIPNSINKLDMRKTYGSFNTLTRIIEPFLLKLQKCEVSLSNFVQLSKSLETSAKSVKAIENSTNKATTSANKLGKALTLSGAYLGVKRLTSQFLDWLDNAIDRTEQMNLFNVVFNNIEKNGVKTFSTLGKEATQFQNKLNEAFGTNMTETMKYQGLFQSMGDNVGIPKEYSALMSETMTKFTYDLASLYNKSETDTGEALRAGVYAGQTKPLRSYGIDVTQTSMQPILDELGIERSVKQLSQAEKEILRYISALRQGQVAMGDFANTVESPANQMKVFKQQLVEAKVALTSLFINAFSEILPYANAILMVIKEISKAIASMFGIELKDYNSGIASQEDAYTDLGESVGNATKKVKELQRQTLGFDNINNINENKNTGGSSGSGSTSGGIDKRLLDAITGYDNGMEKVRMKANEIRDRIMEWLGFTKQIDPITGAVSFKLKDGYSNLKLILGVLGAIGVAKLVTTIGNLIKKMLGVDNLLTLSGSNLTVLGRIIKSLKVNGWTATIGKIATKFKTLLPIIKNVALVVGGLVTTLVGKKGVYNAMKTMTKEVEYGGEQYKKYTLSVLETVGGATLVGSKFGVLGAVIGALSGTVIAGISAIKGYHDGIKELAKEELFGSLSVSQEQWTEIISNTIPSVDNLKNKLTELQSNLDNLYSSYQNNTESLDLLALKYSLTGQKISEEDGQVFLESIRSVGENAKQIIEESGNYNLSTMANIFANSSALTDEEEKNILEKIVTSNDQKKKSIDDAQSKITSIYNTGIKKRGYLTDEEYNEIQKQLSKIKSLVDKEMSKSQTDYEYFKQLANNNMLKLDEQSYTEFEKALNSYLEDRKNASSDTYNVEYQTLKNNLDEGIITQETFNKQIADLNAKRKKDDEETETEVANLRKKVYGDLANEYVKVQDATTSQAKATKKVIEEIFNNINVDSSKIVSDFATSGMDAGKKFCSKFTSEINKSKLKMKVSPTIIQQETFGLKARYEIPLKFNAYADGGIPKHGSMFIAGERGAEIVGNINGRTEVLNQSQIASAIYSAVFSAMSQFNNQSNQIDVHVHTDEGTIVDRINQTTKQTGICPINIPI